MTSMSTSEDAPKTRCPWCKGDCLRWGLETCPFRPRQIPRPRENSTEEELFRAPSSEETATMNADTCVVCRCDLPTECTPVRRADDQRFCTTCLVYFSSAQGR